MSPFNAARDRDRPSPRADARVAAAPSSGVLLSLFAFLAACGSAAARDLSAAELASLSARVAVLNAALMEQDHETVVSFLPPAMVEVMAREGDLDPTALRSLVATIMGARTLGVVLEDIHIDAGSPDVHELADGSPYVLLTNFSRYARKGLGRVQVTSSVLAILDQGEWYMVPIDSSRPIHLLQTAYPGFVGVEFPLGTATAAGQP